MSQSLTRQFLTFCKGKPAEATYNYDDFRRCAFSQFLKAYGYAKDPACSAIGWRDRAKGERCGAHPLPFPDDILANEPETFGALASRLEAHLASLSPLEGKG